MQFTSGASRNLCEDEAWRLAHFRHNLPFTLYFLEEYVFKLYDLDRELTVDTMTFKALTGKLPNYLCELFTKYENEKYNLPSNSANLSLAIPNTNFVELQSHGTNKQVNLRTI